MTYQGKEIKNLLFDLGGVIIDLDRNRCVDSLKALGLTDADNMLGLYRQSGEFLDLEEGKIEVDEFLDLIRPRFTRPVTNEQITQAFCGFLDPIPTSRLRALAALRKHFGVYMLSNTNAMMFGEFIPRLFTCDGHDLAHYFEGMILSFEVHASKPDREIFDQTVLRLGIKPEETLFFDDSQTNVDAARLYGFNAELVPAGTEFTNVIARLWGEEILK